MRFQYIPYIWPLFVSALISLSLGVYAVLIRRNAKGAVSFILSMAAVTVWSLSNAFEMSGSNFYTKLFWANMQYLAYCYSPVTLFIMCLQFTGYDEWIKNKKIWWIAVIPTIIVLLVWTDGLHGLMRYDMRLDYSGTFPVIVKKYGPVFYMHAAYAHFLNIAAWVILIRAVFYKNTVYRKQAAALLLGVSMIVIPNILYILGLSPIKRFDITPVFFGPAGMLMAWGIFRYKMLDLVPMARTTVIETMNAGVMVLDLQNRVLDINPAFIKIIGLPVSKVSTQNVQDVCRKIPELAQACMDRSIVYKEFAVHTIELSMVYEVLLSPLSDSSGALIGRLAVIYEITEKKRAQQMFLKQQWELAAIEERERTARDLHDNLGQVFGFINLQAQGIRQELVNAGVETGLQRIDRLVDAAQSAHHEIRKYIRDARSSVFVEKEFVTTLKKDITRFEEQAGIAVQLNMPVGFTADTLSLNARLNILYIIKEALSNVRKHAQAKHAKLSFSIVHGELCVAIEDDGRGFDTTQHDKDLNNTFGLNIMRERASEIGAEIDIQSIMGKGSRIVLCIPTVEGEKNTYEIDVGR